MILDVAENTTYELQNDLLHWYGEDFPLSVEIASVRDRQRLEQFSRNTGRSSCSTRRRTSMCR